MYSNILKLDSLYSHAKCVIAGYKYKGFPIFYSVVLELVREVDVFWILDVLQTLILGKVMHSLLDTEKALRSLDGVFVET